MNYIVKNWAIWLWVPWMELKLRYRRNKLGPFWLTIGLGVTASMISVVYGAIFNNPLHEVLPTTVTGLICWSLISGGVLSGCVCYVNGASLIKGGNCLPEIFPFKEVINNLLIFAHNLLVLLVVYAFFPDYLNWHIVLFIPNLALICVLLVVWGQIIGFVNARFNDIYPLLTNLMSALIFITPIMFKPSLLAKQSYLVDFNPFFHIVQILRQPLLGELPTMTNYLVVLGIILGLGGIYRLSKNHITQNIALFI